MSRTAYRRLSSGPSSVRTALAATRPNLRSAATTASAGGRRLGTPTAYMVAYAMVRPSNTLVSSASGVV